jgi:hypothetical protein
MEKQRYQYSWGNHKQRYQNNMACQSQPNPVSECHNL